MTIASSSDGYSRYSHTNSKRSIDVPQSHARKGLTAKNHQLLAQNEILGLKSRSPCESRPDNKQQSGQKCVTIGRFHYHTATRVIPDKVFGRHKRLTTSR